MSSDCVFGTVTAPTGGAAGIIESWIESRAGFRVRLIVAVYPTCSTREDDLSRALPMQVRSLRKLFLGNAQTITKLSDAAAERHPPIFHESDGEQNGRT